MSFDSIVEYILFISCLFILFGSVFITFKTGFVQLRMFPKLFQMIKGIAIERQSVEEEHTISPKKALFTAMSTTLGIGTIVGPIIAIHWGGPGALLGFILTAFFGSAATYTEVGLSLKYRKHHPTQGFIGGPMQYLEKLVSPFMAKWYALFGAIVMTAWSGAQSNQLIAILDSPLLENFRIPALYSALFISLLVFFVLIGGIKRLSSLSSKLVPSMFVLYLGSCLWILFLNGDKFWPVCCEIFQSALSPYQTASGALVGGLIGALRWGIFKGTQATEAGVGTQTIPHCMAKTEDPTGQGVLAMLSTFMAGFVAFLTGVIVLITQTWQDPTVPLGINMIAASYKMYFSHAGVALVAICTALFAFGTILGNSFNGSKCFGYLTDNKNIYWYYAGTSLIVFVASLTDVTTVWTVIDLCLACLILPHMGALVRYVYTQNRYPQE